MNKNYYIVLTDKKYDRDKIVGRRKTTLEDVNHQAEFIWSLFNWRERRRYRVLVQGEYTPGGNFYDSDKLRRSL